jgi:predicted glycoside hydrolase/deacetylase ChbG (UPF0249 family)
LNTPNPLLKKLGYSNTDRLAIIHADDVGMCLATLTALENLFDFGLVSSAAAMVPCAWFPSLAKFCREHPQADVGVHTTLNCEWSHTVGGAVHLRPGSELLDEEGYLPIAAATTSMPHGGRPEDQAQLQRAWQPGWM